MASVSIRTRKTTNGEKRFQVRYRLGGRASTRSRRQLSRP